MACTSGSVSERSLSTLPHSAESKGGLLKHPPLNAKRAARLSSGATTLMGISTTLLDSILHQFFARRGDLHKETAPPSAAESAVVLSGWWWIYGRVIVVPSPDAVTEKVPVLLEL